MARHIPGATKGGVDVRASGMMVVRKKIHTDNACMASHLSGKKPGTLGKAQSAFKAARSACKG